MGSLSAKVSESVTTFQAFMGLPQTGVTDQTTWDRLEEVYFSLLEDAVEIQED